MTLFHEMVGWVSDKLVYDVASELDRMSDTLRRGTVDERLSAVRQLAFMKAEDAVALLTSALRDADAEVRQAALRALGQRHRRDLVPSLGVLLGDAVAAVRLGAVEALDEVGAPRRQGLSRFWSERIVAEDDDPRIPELLAGALLDGDAAVRTAALAALPRHGSRGVAIVRRHLEGAGADRVERAAPEPGLVSAIRARQPGHRRAAVEALHALYGADAMKPLAEALRDTDAEVRAAAVAAVTALGPRGALEELLARLDDSDPEVVVKVIEGLVCARHLSTFSETEESRIHAELMRVARREGGRAEVSAAWALGEMGRVEAVGTLCDLLRSSSPEVRVAACDALAKVADPRAAAPLLALVERDDTDEGTAVHAVAALAVLQDVRSVPLLVRRLFAESRPKVEQAVEGALGALCGPAEQAHREALGAAADARARAVAVERAIAEPRLGLALLGELVAAPDAERRAAATQGLVVQGYDLGALARSALTLADKTEARRVLAIELMAQVQPGEAVPLLEGLLADENEPAEVYRHAALALKRIGSEPALAALQARQEDAREPVRAAVQQAMAPAP